LLWRATRSGTCAKSPLEERGRLAADDVEVCGFIERDDDAAAKLDDLAVHEPAERGDELFPRVVIVVRSEAREAKRFDEQEIARQNTHGVAPNATRRRTATPLIAVVDDVVMEERRHVNELGGRSEVTRAGTHLAETCCRKEKAERAHTFAARLEEMRRGLGAGRCALFQAGRDERLNLCELGCDERADLGDSFGRKLAHTGRLSGLLENG